VRPTVDGLSSADDESDYGKYWIDWFLSTRGNEYFCEVDEEYILDKFNLTGLNTEVPHYQKALDLITGENCTRGGGARLASGRAAPDLARRAVRGAVLRARSRRGRHDQVGGGARRGEALRPYPRAVHPHEPRPGQDGARPHGWRATPRASAMLRTVPGPVGGAARLQLDKYKRGDFGKCPRVYCNGQHVLPVGLSDTPNMRGVKLYCPKCNDVYNPKSSKHADIRRTRARVLVGAGAGGATGGASALREVRLDRGARIDGAYFGTTFPHMLFQVYPYYMPAKPTESYVPRIFGFKIHPSAYAQPAQRPRDGEDVPVVP